MGCFRKASRPISDHGRCINFSELSRAVGIPQSTLKRYLTLLETTFLIQMQLPWSGSLGKRLIKAPKLIINDTGLMAHLLGLSKDRLITDPDMAGPLLENFVAMELRKQIAWSRTQPQMFHFRAQTGQEVDMVLEDSSGRLTGIEVKASATISGRDFKGLRALQDLLGKRFLRGVILYTGPECIPFGSRMHALPVSSLWRFSHPSR